MMYTVRNIIPGFQVLENEFQILAKKSCSNSAQVIPTKNWNFFLIFRLEIVIFLKLRPKNWNFVATEVSLESDT